jgi:triosephosphate isomerase
MKKYIFGNFKMNKTLKECEIFVEKFAPLVANCKNEVAIFPSFVNLFYIKQKLTNDKILVE